MTTEKHGPGEIVLGRDTRLSKRLLAVAVGLFALTFLVHTPPWIFPVTFTFGFDLRILFVLTAIPPLLVAYWNDGILVSLALATAPTLAFFVSIAAFDAVFPTPTLTWGVGTGIAWGLAVGVPAYLAGAIARRTVPPG
ncbi:hypothetical protein [Haladaptatus sp. DYF46]|uniref:hypothetical protein n=1 Tax=Haladaptatus sp. DYF46 TaxID=2886041 RepID=UPI001E48F943|nr:hypothetical protein [Haladaptatus sp. DYF46]